ncbi:FAD:protein FMN transferase [Arthrobacter tumbae]|uniref:FAD:protein FMN transferase n=1 Tax=Arthrobacter tumbae TaxID=163874 RepID=UPI0027DCC83C|nr:FAD:protein FMN transferase [Arthrobacter tumbae]MBM7780049.1 thiamine biosynthesis lipoprotein [Arthrobacter tumbae]
MSPAGQLQRFSFDAIGTAWHIDTATELSAEARAAVVLVIEQYDAVYSRFRPDSVISSLAGGGSVTLPPSGEALGDLYRKLYRLTDGAMSPLVGRSLEQLGYDAGYSFMPHGGPVPAAVWDGTFEWSGTTIRSEHPVTLDVGAAGKGQLVDLVSAALRDAGYPEHTVDAGGDMLHRGPTPLRVALEHPYAADSAIGVVDLQDRALCASASNRRRWADGLHHVLDATTGRCVDTVVASWVLADDAMVADALATALFLVPPDVLLAEFDFDYVRISSEGRAQYSSFLTGALF